MVESAIVYVFQWLKTGDRFAELITQLQHNLRVYKRAQWRLEMSAKNSCPLQAELGDAAVRLRSWDKLDLAFAERSFDRRYIQTSKSLLPASLVASRDRSIHSLAESLASTPPVEREALQAITRFYSVQVSKINAPSLRCISTKSSTSSGLMGRMPGISEGSP